MWLDLDRIRLRPIDAATAPHGIAARIALSHAFGFRVAARFCAALPAGRARAMAIVAALVAAARRRRRWRRRRRRWGRGTAVFFHALIAGGSSRDVAVAAGCAGVACWRRARISANMSPRGWRWGWRRRRRRWRGWRWRWRRRRGRHWSHVCILGQLLNLVIKPFPGFGCTGLSASAADRIFRPAERIEPCALRSVWQLLRAAIALAGSFQPHVGIDQIWQRGLDGRDGPNAGTSDIAPVCAVLPHVCNPVAARVDEEVRREAGNRLADCRCKLLNVIELVVCRVVLRLQPARVCAAWIRLVLAVQAPLRLRARDTKRLVVCYVGREPAEFAPDIQRGNAVREQRNVVRPAQPSAVRSVEVLDCGRARLCKRVDRVRNARLVSSSGRGVAAMRVRLVCREVRKRVGLNHQRDWHFPAVRFQNSSQRLDVVLLIVCNPVCTIALFHVVARAVAVRVATDFAVRCFGVAVSVRQIVPGTARGKHRLTVPCSARGQF